MMSGIRSSGARDALRTCPCCGGNRPERALLLCRTCYNRLPFHVKKLAMSAAEKDRDSMRMGEKAAQVIAKAVALKP